MKGLFSQTNDAAYNLATEEYLLRHTQEDVFFLYINSPSIIIGKHQNTLAEINYQFINRSNIPVFRRLSGGGTVYHDFGNLNFCFIQTGQKGELVNFEKYTRPIQNALIKLGLDVEFGKRHDLLIHGKKISGNASHVYKNRVMHHGTLLYNSDLNVLNNALKTNPIAFTDKAVKSVRSEVTNLYNHLDRKLSFEAFYKYIFTTLLEANNENIILELTSIATEQIELLVSEKYTTWKWNYGYSPTFELKKRLTTKDKIRYISSLLIEKGIISKLEIKSSKNELDYLLELIKIKLIGTQHEKKMLRNILNQMPEIANEKLVVDEILELLF